MVTATVTESDDAEFAEAASRESYLRSLRSAVRGLWTDALSLADFRDAMESAIRKHLTAAWEAGARTMDVEPDELSADELKKRDDFIDDEYGYIANFADAIRENNKARGGALAPLLTRAELWANRWDEVFAQAMVMAGKDAKLEWVLGATEQHCTSCLALNGKVKRASEWDDYGILPRSRELECKGYNCDCELRKTNKRLSRGALPQI